MKECNQFECSYHPDNDKIKQGVAKHFYTALCPVCAECGAEQHQINEGCQNCLLCECREGYIRFGQPKPLAEIVIKHKNDVEIVKEMIVTEKDRSDDDE